MKKLFALLITLSIATYCHAQKFYKVYKATYMEYTNHEWVDVRTNYPEKMYVIMDGYNIKITNEYESKYITYGDGETTTYPTHQTFSWSCYDANGNNCDFMIKKFNEGSTYVYITYLSKGYAFEYQIDNK
jgi:hypothetical protein